MTRKPRRVAASAVGRSAGWLAAAIVLVAGGCKAAQPMDEMDAFKREVYALAAIERWSTANVGKALSTRLVKTTDNGASTSFEANSGTLAGYPLSAVELRCLNYYPDECLLIVELAEPGPSASEFAKRFWPRSEMQLLGSHKLSVAWSHQEGPNEISISHDVDGKRIDSVVIERIRSHPHPTPEPLDRPLPPLPPLPPQPPESSTDEAQVPGEIVAPPGTVTGTAQGDSP